jgi:acyl-CoA reductase-like NAD-dependent aldehyde dehydrogenase
VINGGAGVGRAVVEESLVNAIAVTGSIATGQAIAARCAVLGKPLQAELGGNNAAIVLADADLDEVVPTLIGNAFAYSGQRCTAVRRFVVHADILDDFARRAADAIEQLVLGVPSDESTDVGPLITRPARDRVAAVVDRALDSGAVLLAGGYIPTELGSGSWYAPTLLLVEDRQSEIVQEETFGPVAVIQCAEDVDDAISAANGVVQGLLMVVCTSAEEARDRVQASARVGLLQFGAGALRVHPDAPFGGWKASGHGPPEHGRWDAQFFTRPQAVY